MPIPVIAAVAGGAILEASTGLISKTFKKAKKSTTSKPRKATKKASGKATKRKTTSKKTAGKKRTTAKSGALNKSTGRLKKGYKYAKGGRIVKAKSK